MHVSRAHVRLTLHVHWHVVRTSATGGCAVHLAHRTRTESDMGYKSQAFPLVLTLDLGIYSIDPEKRKKTNIRYVFVRF